MKVTKAEVEEARTRLLAVLKPGDTVYCILRNVSRSGMSRVISLYARTDDGMTWLDPFASKLGVGDGMDWKREGLKVGGAGMDMGFALVYDLSCKLWPNGFGCVGEKCPSNDHSNGDRDYTPHGHRGPQYVGTRESLKHWHREAGYSLTRQWL